MRAFVRVPAPLAASIRRALLPAGMLLLAAASLAGAQQAPEAARAPRQSIAINPIGAVFGIYQAEIERSVLPGTSIGLSSSYWKMGMGDEESISADVSYLTVDGIVRYYPGGRSLQGFSLGGTIGYAGLTGSLTDEEGQVTDRANAVAAGLVLDYNWLIGERFLVGTGIGAKRLFPIGINTDGVALAYPTFRLSVGYAF